MDDERRWSAKPLHGESRSSESMKGKWMPQAKPPATVHVWGYVDLELLEQQPPLPPQWKIWL
jgi:hypothetical protein